MSTSGKARVLSAIMSDACDSDRPDLAYTELWPQDQWPAAKRQKGASSEAPSAIGDSEAGQAGTKSGIGNIGILIEEVSDDLPAKLHKKVCEFCQRPALKEDLLDGHRAMAWFKPRYEGKAP